MGLVSPVAVATEWCLPAFPSWYIFISCRIPGGAGSGAEV